MSHRWKVDLRAGSYYESLALHLDSVDIGLAFDNDAEMGVAPHAFSRHLDGLDDPVTVSARLLTLELLLNGALRLVYGDDIFFSNPVRFEEFWDLENGGRHRSTAILPDDDPFERSFAPVSAEDLPSDSVARLIALSRGDVDLRILMFQVGLLSWPGQTGQLFAWVSLYNVYETTKTLAGERQVDAYAYVEPSRIDAFRGACNNMSVLGLSARHGLKKRDGPKAPTPKLDEATRDVMAMARTLAQAVLPEGSLSIGSRRGVAQAKATPFNTRELFDDL